MADIILRNGWNQPTTYYNVSSVSFATENGEATYYEEGTGIGGPSVQSDWLQNNPTKADYIKNKPFGRWRDPIGDPVTTSSIETEDGRHRLESTLRVDDIDSKESIAVLWHQILYQCDIKQTDSGEIYIGNNSTFTDENDIPFHGIYNEDTQSFTFFCENPVNGLTVGLFEAEETNHIIDKDSLPQTWWGNPIEGGGSSVQADWSVTDIESPSYIKNKPTIPKDRSDDIDAIQEELGLNDEGKTRLELIEDKLDNLDIDVDISDIEGLVGRFEKIEGALVFDEEGSSTRLDQIDHRLDAVDGEEGALAKINEHLSAIDNEDEDNPGHIQQLSSRLDKLDNEENGEIKLIKDRLDDIDSENGRLDIVESEVDILQQVLQIDEGNKSARLDAIDGEDGRLQQIDESLDEIDDTLIEHQENIEAIQTELGVDEEGNFTRLVGIEEVVEEHDTDITQLKKDVAIQSDWNELNPVSKSYVKNRPFFKDVYTHNFSNTSWTKTNYKYQNASIYMNSITFDQTRQHEQLSVKWKNKIYNLSRGEVEVYNQEDLRVTANYYLFGNLSLWVNSQDFHQSYKIRYTGGDSTAPFCFVYFVQNIPNVFYTIDNTVAFDEIFIYTLQQLDKEFIPEEAFAPQAQADWLEEDITSPSYIVNKPALSNQQSDWNEVNNTSSSYINNKPFGYADAIFSEKEISFTYDENSETYQAPLGQLQNLIVGSYGDGESFSVYYDSTKYNNLKENLVHWDVIQEFTGFSSISRFYIGNTEICPLTPASNISNYFPAKNNLPFIIWSEGNGATQQCYIATFDNSPTHKIRIEYTTPKKNLLSKEWLPADLIDTNKANQLFSEKVKQPDWNETDTSSPAYINNKPTSLDPPDWNATEGQGGYIKNKPADQDFQANWDETDKDSLSYIKNLPSSFANWDAEHGEFGYIKNKPSIPQTLYSNWQVTSKDSKRYIYHRPFGYVDNEILLVKNQEEISNEFSQYLPKNYHYFTSKSEADGPDINEGETYTIKVGEEKAYTDTVKFREVHSSKIAYGLIGALVHLQNNQGVIELTYMGNLSIVCPNIFVSAEEKEKDYCILSWAPFEFPLEAFFHTSNNWTEVTLTCKQFLKIPSRYLPDDFSSETINTLLSEIQQLKQQVQSLTDRVTQLESGGGSGDDDNSGASVEGTILTINGSVNNGILNLDSGRVENGILITTSNNSTSTVENNELTTEGTVQNGVLEGTGTVTDGIWEV